jgi:hypothetical protein
MPAAPLAYDCAGVPRKGAATVAVGKNDVPGGVVAVPLLDGVGPLVAGVLAAAGTFGGCLASLMIATAAPARQARTTTTATSDQMRPRLAECGPRVGSGTGARSFLALRALRRPIF